MTKIKDITKELTGKSLCSFHHKTGLPQLEEANKMQDGILDGILSQVDDAYITKTEQSNVIHLEGSGDGVVVLDSIEGNTLVNCITTNIDASIKFTANGTAKRFEYKVVSKGNTTYTLVANITKNTINHNLGLIGWHIETNNRQVIVPNGFVGLFKQSFTTKADIGENWYMDFWKENTEGEIEFNNFMVLEGDWSEKEIPASYFEGLQSSFEEKVNDEGKYEIEILMNNKNLIDRNDFNINSLTNISYNPNSGIITHNGMGYGDIQFYIYLHKDTSYFLSCETTLTYTNFNVMYGRTSRYDSSLVATGGKFNSSFVVNRSGWYTIHFANNSSDGVKGTISNLQLEKNTLFNNYVSPRQNKIKVSINEPLRAIDDVKDRLCVKDGRLIIERNTFLQVLNGQEIWNTSNTLNTSNTTRYYTNTLKIPMKLNTNGISDKIPYIINGGNDNMTCIYVHSAVNRIDIRRLNSDNRWSTLEELKTWLRNNNITLVLKRLEPVYEEVLNEYGEPIILEGYENGTIYIDSNIVPTTTVRYTPKIESFKVCSEVKENNVALSSDINDNIITYMMDIDLMITEKELITLDVQAINQRMEVLDMTSMQKRTQDMLARLIKGKTLTEQECKDRIILYVNANKITAEQAEELMLLISETYQ